jgi:hypothetical protein
MRYTRLDSTLLPVSPTELRLAERVPFRDLRIDRLLFFDASVSDFYFEFEPQEDVDRFLQHAHFGGMLAGRLVACREDLCGVAALQANAELPPTLTVSPEAELPKPLKFALVPEFLAAIQEGGEWRGRLTVCSCGFAGCFSQYAWVRESLCLALFTISGTSLVEVAWRPFQFAV